MLKLFKILIEAIFYQNIFLPGTVATTVVVAEIRNTHDCSARKRQI